ncbi:hypothetical protein AAE478_007674 [Parahypoxylon ruwenzoriense]
MAIDEDEGFEEESFPPKYDDIIEAEDDSDGTLTFGIELEFLIPAVKFGADDPHPFEERPVFKCEDEGLSIEQSNPQILSFLQKQVPHIPFRLAFDDTYYYPHDIPRYDRWRLIKDASVVFKGCNSPRTYAWLGRELTSEVMKSDDPTFYTRRITDICRAIRSLRVHLNETTSVHVHVGRGEESFTLLTLKKFATLVFLADTMLLGLHHPSRRDSMHCRLLKDSSSVGRKTLDYLLEANNPLTKAQAQQMSSFVPPLPPSIRTLQGSESIERLACLMCDENPDFGRFHRGTVSFSRFLPFGKTGGNTHTFEFRQMGGCLEPNAIIHWVKVCVAITDFARLSDAQTYKKLLQRVSEEDSTFSAFDLLRELGLGEEEKYFRDSVKGYEKSQAFYEGADDGNLFLSPME